MTAAGEDATLTAPGRRTVTLADGRDVEFQVTGDASADRGLALVVHEGTPSGLVLNRKLAAAAAERGLRVVQAARPGYENSTPRPGRTVGDVAGDLTAVLDAAGVSEFVAVGFSGGGPHSLASAALLPGRCLAAASVAGVAPYRAEGLDFLAGMGPENVAEFGAAARGPRALTDYLQQEAAALGSVTGEQISAALGGLISEADAAVLTGEFADDVARSLRGALRNGIAGWRDDDLAFLADWGFPLSELGGRVAIWQGDQDNMVPFAHGRWLAAHIPGARVHLEPGAGHVTMTVTAISRILDELLELAGRR